VKSARWWALFDRALTTLGVPCSSYLSRLDFLAIASVLGCCSKFFPMIHVFRWTPLSIDYGFVLRLRKAIAIVMATTLATNVTSASTDRCTAFFGLMTDVVSIQWAFQHSVVRYPRIEPWALGTRDMPWWFLSIHILFCFAINFIVVSDSPNVRKHFH